MIKCKFFKKNEKFIGYSINGHAGYAEYGSDIVCASVSVLGQSIANGITEVLKVNPNISINEDGLLSVSLEDNNSKEIEQCQVLLETLYINLYDLEKSYGDYIKLTVKEEV